MQLLQRAARKTSRLLGLSSEPSAAEQFWSSAFDDGGIDTWLSEPRVRQVVNAAVTDFPHEWPLDCFRRLYASEPFKNALSVGCGEGALERDVRRKNIARRITGTDLSRSALATARKAAARERLARIRYRRADFNTFKLPRRRYDIVFFHQSMHHVEGLEHCLAEVHKALKSGGLLYLDEYVGPSRDDWNEELLTAANEVFAKLPAKARKSETLPLPVESRDPSEAIRSAEIVPLVRASFEVLHQRDYGGNVLALAYPSIAWGTMDEDEKNEVLDLLIGEEQRLLAAGAPSFYTVLLARKALAPPFEKGGLGGIS